MTKSRGVNRPKTVWTEQQMRVLQQQYPDRRTADIAEELGISVELVYRGAVRLGLKKSEEYLESKDACRLRRGDNIGAGFRYSKGHVPANKGLRRPGYAAGRMSETQFKKGRRPEDSTNYKPIGSLRINRDGHLERKISDDQNFYPARRWTPVYRLVWESEHGQIPRGHIVRFKKGLATAELNQITVDKLECVSKADNMKQNTIHQYGPEIASITRLRGSLTRQINKKEKLNER